MITKNKLSKIIIYLFLLSWLIITGYPLIFLLQNSFKGNLEFFTNPVWSLPASFNLENYIHVGIGSGFYRYFLNSIFVCLVSVMIIILASSMVAYAIAKLKFKFSNLVFILFVAGMMIPIHSTLIPVYKMTLSLGLYDNLIGLIGPYVAFSLPVSIFILTGFIKEIPCELEEAAVIDGASYYKIFGSVIMPLVKPAISTIAIYNLTMLWNEFAYALVLTSSPEKRILTLGLFEFQSAYGMDIPKTLTALLLSVLPLIIMYIFFQEKIIKGMTAGALKG
ncbi:ABC transporter permease subunit [Iocasia frigidifontis]|uniref:ABC transporter permease subunit n=1 Tax=Iocasia fonsfrigidae TaxID=2682810 RepID=A0A8A7KB29_9FIRM|nr:carbohydrate ABC transporter permease [Iocasia fonsfrigidae]QTL99043.1 ABC transporter permease subunit [Iocasia fonsfrigidae]